MALNSHTSGGYWHSILTPRGATGTGARDTGGYWGDAVNSQVLIAII